MPIFAPRYITILFPRAEFNVLLSHGRQPTRRRRLLPIQHRRTISHARAAGLACRTRQSSDTSDPDLRLPVPVISTCTSPDVAGPPAITISSRLTATGRFCGRELPGGTDGAGSIVQQRGHDGAATGWTTGECCGRDGRRGRALRLRSDEECREQCERSVGKRRRRHWGVLTIFAMY